jgi:DNA-binding MarR family transcriptional regulator
VTKRDVLAALAEAGEADASDIAEALGVPYATSAMALVRLVRQGLAGRRWDPDRGTYVYWVTDHGHARLAFFEGEAPVPQHRPGAITRPVHWKGDHPVKRRKFHTGTYHCPACFIEFDLTAEESLKCDQCGGPLAKGPLDNIWDDDEEEGDEDVEE